MRADLYQAETARVASLQVALLDTAREILAHGRPLSLLEQHGVLHALQLLVENAIGKAKQLLKTQGMAVPVSAYDAFAALAATGRIDPAQLAAWNAIIGLRNRIVHDYMNLDMDQILAVVLARGDRLVADFLLADNGP